MKLYIQGFRGPWGWVNDFEKFLQGTEIQIASADECDVLFQCDQEAWGPNMKYLGSKLVVANILDYAEWVGGNPNIEAYVDQFCRKADIVTAICNKVIKQTAERGIKAEMFYYPSQVDQNIIDACKDIPKKKQIITFSRLHDKAKKVEVAVNAFCDSKLRPLGWKYILVGPQKPSFTLPTKVEYAGLLPKDYLYQLVAESRLNINAEIGTGLGLPGIESVLVGTIPLCRNIDPLSDVLGCNSIFFEKDDDIHRILNDFADDDYDKSSLRPTLVSHWQRENAFVDLYHSLLKIWNDEHHVRI